MPKIQLLNNTPTRQYEKLDFPKYMSEHPIVKKNKGQVLFSTIPSNPIRPNLGGNGFISAMVGAYNNHHNLVISPDDVWTSISVAFATFIDNHAEEMRKYFVDHDGKQTIIVYGHFSGSKVETTEGSYSGLDWDLIMTKFSEELKKKTKNEIAEWIMCDFSTTDLKSKLISQAVLMGAMKSYFDFKVMIECGLPSVELTGTKDDWVKIKEKVQKLSLYSDKFPEMEKWRALLTVVINKFIEVFDGVEDKDFWQSISNFSGGGSGPTYLSGFCTVFLPFTSKGVYQLKDYNPQNKYPWNFAKIDTGKISSGAIECPFIIDDNGFETKNMFYAGALCSSYDQSTNTMRSSSEWCVFRVPN